MEEDIIKIIATTKTIAKDQLLEDLEGVLRDANYDLTRARSPKSKRQKAAALRFFSSIYKHLKGL